MRPSSILSLPVTPTAVADAMALVATPDIAALLPESMRRLAWQIAASRSGMRVVQRHRPAGTQRVPE